MRMRDGAVAFASATVFTGALAGVSPEIAHAYDTFTTPHVNVAAGRIALGDHLTQAVAAQQDSVVEIDTPGVPTYVTIQGQQYRASDTPLMGSGVVLPFKENGEQLVATAGHVGIRKQNGQYNCANQIINSFVPGDEAYVQEPVKSGFGFMNDTRDAAVVRTAADSNFTAITKVADNPVDHMKTGEPVYITGYSHTGADDQELIDHRTPANVVADSNELNTPQDIAHPVTIGGLALSVSKDEKRLYVLSSVDRSYGPAYNDKVYPGDSGGGVFTKSGGFLGVLTNIFSDQTPAQIKKEFGVQLTNTTTAKYQVSIVNLMSAADINSMAANTRQCPDSPDPIIDHKK